MHVRHRKGGGLGIASATLHLIMVHYFQLVTPLILFAHGMYPANALSEVNVESWLPRIRKPAVGYVIVNSQSEVPMKEKGGTHTRRVFAKLHLNLRLLDLRVQ